MVALVLENFPTSFDCLFNDGPIAISFVKRKWTIGQTRDTYVALPVPAEILAECCQHDSPKYREQLTLSS